MDKLLRRQARSRRTNAQTQASGRPRIVVYRSIRTIHAQLVNETGTVVCGTSGLKSKKKGLEMAAEVGAELAKQVKAKKIKKVTFDRNGYKYHGQVKALAEAAREGGLEF
jgi:large subunit ribosomal protein L18